MRSSCSTERRLASRAAASWCTLKACATGGAASAGTLGRPSPYLSLQAVPSRHGSQSQHRAMPDAPQSKRAPALTTEEHNPALTSASTGSVTEEQGHASEQGHGPDALVPRRSAVDVQQRVGMQPRGRPGKGQALCCSLDGARRLQKAGGCLVAGCSRRPAAAVTPAGVGGRKVAGVIGCQSCRRRKPCMKMSCVYLVRHNALTRRGIRTGTPAGWHPGAPSPGACCPPCWRPASRRPAPRG